MDSRDVLVALISGTCDYVPLHGKRDFADVIKVMGFEIWRLPRTYLGGPKLIMNP